MNGYHFKKFAVRIGSVEFGFWVRPWSVVRRPPIHSGKTIAGKIIFVRHKITLGLWSGKRFVLSYIGEADFKNSLGGKCLCLWYLSGVFNEFWVRKRQPEVKIFA